MKTILVPTDFSQSALHAAEFAISLAHVVDARLVLLNILKPIPDSYNLPMASSQLMLTTEATAENEMEKFRKKLDNSLKNLPPIETKIVYGGISSTIIDVADDLNVEYLVMGTLGADSSLKKLFGSNALRVAKNAHCPVWIIPKKTNLLGIKSIVYATDLAGEEIEILNKIINIAEFLEANVQAVHIHGKEEPEEEPSKEIIKFIKNDFAEKSIAFKNLQRSDTVKGLDAYIKSHRPDLIILAHEERSIFDKLFHTSVIKHLSLTSKTPLLILQKEL